jgi:hypothetical protein
MRKHILLATVLMAFAAAAFAAPVSEGTARGVAARFWNMHRPDGVKPAETLTALTFDELPHLHIFNVDGTGFVIVSGDDRALPVLAYSYNSLFPTELNPEVGYWLRGYESQLAEIAPMKAPASTSVDKKWKDLLAKDSDSVTSLINIPEMLITRWDQGNPFNMYCPYDSMQHDRTVVGCVATAMVQIMRYWEYPWYGAGNRTYSYEDFIDITADFEHASYPWPLMPAIVDELATIQEQQAAARASYHCGVAVEMMYGVAAIGGSGAYSYSWAPDEPSAVSAFIQHFKYNPDLYYTSRYEYTDSAWMALLDSQLVAGRPIYYNGRDSTGGHAFIFDGVDEQHFYHVNWGWKGNGNGYYLIDTLAPGYHYGIGDNATTTFNYGQGAIVDIFPALVETFDTVDYWDSVCNNQRYKVFRDYRLPIGNYDTLLRQSDTVFRYHLKVISQKYVYYNPNGARGETQFVQYCPATGIVLPACSFQKDSCIFVGWCRKRNGQDSIYQPGDVYQANNNPTFYCIWRDTNEVEPPVVIGEADEDAPVALWPNPTSDQLSIAVPAHTSQIVVMDELGRKVMDLLVKDSSTRVVKISLLALPKGIYSLQLRTESGVYNQRVIKH